MWYPVHSLVSYQSFPIDKGDNLSKLSESTQIEKNVS